MDLKLKNIKMHKGHDDDHCYTAALYLGRKPIALVENDGWGGGESFAPHPKGKLNSEEVYEFIKTVNTWYETQKPQFIFSDGQPMFTTVDMFCCDAVNDFLLGRQLKREIKRNTVILKDGEISIYKIGFNPVSKAKLIKQLGECQFLNEIPLKEAVIAVRESTK